MQWIRNLFSRNTPDIPADLWQAAIARLPFIAALPDHDLSRLKQLAEALLEKKTFTGAGGLELSDEVAVLIAAQAALPVLNLTLDLYRDMPGVIVYPSAFIIPQAQVDEAGVVHEWRAPVSGEALDAGGAVVLSWEDVEDTEAPGYNVVIHEFAHKIDMMNGSANGRPPFLAPFHAGIDMQEWRRVFLAAFENFRVRVEQLESRLPQHFNEDNPAHAALYDQLCAGLPLDPYAAEHPAEFFAVASEEFFVLPQPLAAAYPEVYRLLSLYYRQDPMAR